MNKKLTYLLGTIFLLVGIYLSVFQTEPHFYTFFSVGLFLIFLQIYNSLSEKKLFHKWGEEKYVVFIILILGFSVLADRIGLFLGFWEYQYISQFDEIIKYIFEWGFALLYITLSFMIGTKLFEKIVNKKIAWIFSILTAVILIGIFTEFINIFPYSWRILAMPFTNVQVWEFFVIHQTIGYMIMAIIPFAIYKFVERLK